MEFMQECCERFKPYAVFAAGALFGAGWWVWGDSIAHSMAVLHQPFNPLYLVPGLVATLGIILMNCVSRGGMREASYGDESELCRTRLVLFVAYVFSVAAISGAVVVLLSIKQQEEKQQDLWIGASGVIQACLITASGMVSWFFRDTDDSSYGYMY